MREALQIFWPVADGYAKGRLLLALALVAGGALLASLTPIALKLVVDFLSSDAGSGTVLAPTAPADWPEGYATLVGERALPLRLPA